MPISASHLSTRVQKCDCQAGWVGVSKVLLMFDISKFLFSEVAHLFSDVALSAKPLGCGAYFLKWLYMLELVLNVVSLRKCFQQEICNRPSMNNFEKHKCQLTLDQGLTMEKCHSSMAKSTCKPINQWVICGHIHQIYEFPLSVQSYDWWTIQKILILHDLRSCPQWVYLLVWEMISSDNWYPQNSKWIL